MQDTITTIYCLCDDLLRAMNYTDDPQVVLTSAEVMTVPLVAAAFHGGNIDLSRRFLQQHGYFNRNGERRGLSKSRLNRRLHALPTSLWQTLFDLLAHVFKQTNPDQSYVADSLPVPVCDNIRIWRCQLFAEYGAALRGYIASKKRYFYGLRVHLVVTGQGQPVEFVLAVGSASDISMFRALALDLPEGAILYGDKAYTDYDYEDLLAEAGITLQAQRRKNSRRPLAPCLEFIGQPIRQRIETSFSGVTGLFPKKIHAVTDQGFLLKVICFLLAYSFHCLL